MVFPSRTDILDLESTYGPLLGDGVRTLQHPFAHRVARAPCINNYYNVCVPEFVQNDYFCESGTTARNPVNNRLYDEDPLEL